VAWRARRGLERSIYLKKPCAQSESFTKPLGAIPNLQDFALSCWAGRAVFAGAGAGRLFFFIFVSFLLVGVTEGGVHTCSGLPFFLLALAVPSGLPRPLCWPGGAVEPTGGTTGAYPYRVGDGLGNFRAQDPRHLMSRCGAIGAGSGRIRRIRHDQPGGMALPLEIRTAISAGRWRMGLGADGTRAFKPHLAPRPAAGVMLPSLRWSLSLGKIGFGNGREVDEKLATGIMMTILACQNTPLLLGETTSLDTRNKAACRNRHLEAVVHF
jgi:hypothetical protein